MLGLEAEPMTSQERDDRLSHLEADLARLIRVVDGEGEIAPGVVGILRRHEDNFVRNHGRIADIELTISRAKWTIAGAATAGSLLGGGMVFVIQQATTG